MEGSGKRDLNTTPRRVNILESTGGVNEKTRRKSRGRGN
jgi:hypothetical protein